MLPVILGSRICFPFCVLHNLVWCVPNVNIGKDCSCMLCKLCYFIGMNFVFASHQEIDIVLHPHNQADIAIHSYDIYRHYFQKATGYHFTSSHIITC